MPDAPPAPPTSPPSGDRKARLPPLSDRVFRSFQRLIHDEAGILLGESKRALMIGRLAGRVRELGLPSFGEYYRRLREDGVERAVMLDRIVTNETRFFREPKQFQFLEDRVFPAWADAARGGARRRRIRAWSAACSTGEEPYSVAMALLARFPAADGWEVEVHATDLSTRALARARAAVWPIGRANDIPGPYLSAFMLRGKGSKQGCMKAYRGLREHVRFDRLNLNAPAYAVPGPFDLVFCRNVLIYFDPAGRAAVIEKLLRHLAPHGYLLLGHAESLTGLNDLVRSVGPTVYAHARSAPPWGG